MNEDSRQEVRPSSGNDVADDAFGLFPPHAFTILPAPASWPGVLPQALWYFRGEAVALPVAGTPVAEFARGIGAFEDVRRWAAAVHDPPPMDRPPLVWVAASETLRGARVVDGGAAIVAGGRTWKLDLVARHPLNQSWLDASSFSFLSERTITARGTLDGARFVARTIWPEDFVLGDPPEPRDPGDGDPAACVRALMREEPRGGAKSPFAAWTLWRRPGSSPRWAGKPALAFIVNGAQGDDDEAHAGHFAIVTGRVRADGAIGDWLVNNFYTLDSESEKGILAAPVPLDNYLADLNAGQAWYRPTHLLVAVLDDARAPSLVQSALGRVYNQFYRHQLVYYHPRINCTSISVDTLGALGWRVRPRGASGRLRAVLALPWLLARERSLDGARRASDYLSAEGTRLLPAAAFEEIAAALLAFRRSQPQEGGRLAQWLAHDMCGLALLRIPQLPSSRAWGDSPVVSLAEYRRRLPRRTRDYRVVPVPDRPFPSGLRDDDLLPPAPSPANAALVGWGVATLAGLGAAAWRLFRG